MRILHAYITQSIIQVLEFVRSIQNELVDFINWNKAYILTVNFYIILKHSSWYNHQKFDIFVSELKYFKYIILTSYNMFCVRVEIIEIRTKHI